MRVVLIAAQSLDGFITQHDEPGAAFTSPEDKAYFQTVLADFDCCVLGAETYRVSREFIRSQSPGRPLRLVLTRSPDRFSADAIPGSLEFTNGTPAAVLTGLQRRGLEQCALLGGAQIHSLFFEAGLVDQLWLTVEPRLFGGGTPLFARRLDARLALRSVEKLGANTLLLKYAVAR